MSVSFVHGYRLFAGSERDIRVVPVSCAGIRRLLVVVDLAPGEEAHR